MKEGKVCLSVNGRTSIIEDHLTLVVFSLFSYLSPGKGILEWIRRARPFSPGVGPLEFGADAQVSLELWPGTKEHGIPDIVMSCRAGEQTQALVIEAKYGAGKSQWGDDPDARGVGGDDNSDQLARYWHAMRRDAFSWVADWPRGLPVESQNVIYLTPDFLPPREELHESQNKAADMRLYWLSWRDAWAVVEDYPAPNETEKVILKNLKELFEGLGLAEFRRFSQSKENVVIDAMAVWRFQAGWDLSQIDLTQAVGPARWRFVGEEG